MDDKSDRAANSLGRLNASGGLSEASRRVVQTLKDPARQIGAGLGEQGLGKELLLATILVDDSTSIGPLISHVREGHSLMLEALEAESQQTPVQVLTRALNRGLVAPFADVAQASRLTPVNFSGNDQVPATPLYLQSLLTLFTVMTKAQEEANRGVQVRTFTLIITDGADEFSGVSTTAADVRAVVTDMLEFASNHIIAGMGIGERCDFRAVFRAMGINSVYTAGATVEELRGMFRKIAKDLQLAASSEAAFAQLAAGSSD